MRLLRVLCTAAGALALAGCLSAAAPAPRGEFMGNLRLAVEDHSGCGPVAQAAGKPCIVQTKDGRTSWAVEKPFTYRTHAGDFITVPAGMTTDLASVPRFAWALIPPDGPWVQAAVVHDFLYLSRGTCILWENHPKGCTRATPYTREEADQIIDQAMADLSVGIGARVAIWSAIRAGGANGWGH